MGAVTSSAGAGKSAKRPEEMEDLPDICSRPSCRKEFRRPPGPRPSSSVLQ
jgi:hypothetical protein